MSFWGGLQITLKHVFEAATAIPFIWDDEARKMMQKPFGILALGQCITVGRDLAHYNFKDGSNTCELFGHRELTINVQIFSRHSHGEASSRALIEKARVCLAHPTYRDELRSAGLVFVENHSVADLQFTFQNRVENRSAFDVVFRLILQEKIPTTTKYFDRIELENHL